MNKSNRADYESDKSIDDEEDENSDIEDEPIIQEKTSKKEKVKIPI